MSGGVDSSVAAWLLKQQGYDVVGVFMKNWEDDDTDEYCTSREDLVDAASVADVIGIELDAVNFAAEYRERVFAQFLREYEAGRTPNPDVLCNSEIKFAAFLDHALALGADAHRDRPLRARARGGRRRRAPEGGGREQGPELLPASADAGAACARCCFRWASMRKRDVRAIARREGIPTHAKKDSTGICFIGERPFREFLARYLPRTPGPIVTPEGRVVGEHQGLAYYTLGQRQGLGIGGMRARRATRRGSSPARMSRRNALVVVQGHDHPLLYRARRRGDRHALDRGRARPAARALRREDALSHGGRARARVDVGATAVRRAIRRAAVGADARAVSRAVRRRRVPRRRRDRRAGEHRARQRQPATAAPARLAAVESLAADTTLDLRGAEARGRPKPPLLLRVGVSLKRRCFRLFND